MARFRGTIQGTRGEASRLGTAATGLTSVANGWNVGGEVEISDDNGGDVVDFTLTAGSGRGRSARTFARYVEGDNTPTIYPAAFEWQRVGPDDDPDGILRAQFRFGDAARFTALAYCVTSVAGLNALRDGPGVHGRRQTTYIDGLAYVVYMTPNLTETQ